MTGVFLLTLRKSGSRTVDLLMAQEMDKELTYLGGHFVFHDAVTMVTSPTPTKCNAPNKRMRQIVVRARA